MKPAVPKPQRCTIYTRKSTEHNLDLEFNSLDAQREACEAYIKSQAHEGWRLIPDHYDDGGLSGASLVLAIDLAPRGITCVLLNPGWVRTDMGGPTAPLSPQESVTAMRRLIETFGPNQSGKFYNYDGREYPW